ncbi:MAG: hypothetical protein KDJ46_03920 [Rhodobiaceae bacterium]|nr:hypothetical protein [Rhodobiaceae bacterium]
MNGVLKPKLSVKLRAAAHCPTHSLAQVSVRDLLFLVDEPAEPNGTTECNLK